MSHGSWLLSIGWRAGLTCLAVALVLGLVRKAGSRAGGWAAALPITSVPALLWMSFEQGAGFAAAAATAALHATALTAVFAGLYGRRARSAGPAASLLTSAGIATVLALLTAQAGAALVTALPLAVVTLLGVKQRLSRTPRQPARAATSWRDAVLTVVVAGTVTAAAGLLALRIPAWMCGLIVAIPVIGICTTVNLHMKAGAAALSAFLRAYVDGLLAKAAFLATLAIVLPMQSVAAWPLGLACGALVAWGLGRLNAARPGSAGVDATLSCALPHDLQRMAGLVEPVACPVCVRNPSA